MLVLCSDETYETMNYKNELWRRGWWQKKDGIDDNNAASTSGSNGLIIDPIIMHWFHGGGYGDDGDGAATTAHYISTFLKMCHKLLYANFDVLDWCLCHIKKQLN